MLKHFPRMNSSYFWLTAVPILYFAFISILAIKGFLGRCDAIPWVVSSVIISPLIVLIAFVKTIYDKEETLIVKIIMISIQISFISYCVYLLARNIK